MFQISEEGRREPALRHYIHYNPVKHGYVTCPRDWEPSSFHCWVKKGVYPIDWACGHYPPPKIIDRDYGEPG